MSKHVGLLGIIIITTSGNNKELGSEVGMEQKV
jgi:hypothetical protein